MSLCYEKKKSFVLYHERPALWRIYVTISVVPFTSRSLHITSSFLGNCAISCFFINHIQLNSAQNRTTNVQL
jgi:hypothetical protein